MSKLSGEIRLIPLKTIWKMKEKLGDHLLESTAFGSEGAVEAVGLSWAEGDIVLLGL